MEVNGNSTEITNQNGGQKYSKVIPKIKIQVHKVESPEDLQIVFAIRRKVYVIGQKYPEEIEQEHEEESIHFLAKTEDGRPCGVSRWRETELGFKLERFAVLEEFRGQDVGATLMKHVLADLPSHATYIYLISQTQAMGFYAKFGFVAEGEILYVAGNPHRKMVKRFWKSS